MANVGKPEESSLDSPGFEGEDRPTRVDVFLAKRQAIRTQAELDLQTVKASMEQISLEKKLDAQLMLSKLRRHLSSLAHLDDMVLANWYDPADLDAEIEVALQYQMKLSTVVDRLEWQCRDLELAEASQMVSKGGSTPRCVPVKTPKLELTRFDGNPLAYEAFMDDFTCSVDARTDLSVVDKFKLLKQSLEGEALTMTEGYFLTMKGYEEVKAALKDRFGDPQIAIHAHFEALLELKPASHEAASLVQIRDKCEAHIRSLEALGLREETFGLVFAPIILSKMPKFVKMELHRRNGSEKWTLTALRKHLKDARLSNAYAMSFKCLRNAYEIFARAKSDRAFGVTGSEGASLSSTQKRSEKSTGSKKKQPEHTGSALLVQESKGKKNLSKKGKSPKKEPVCRFCQGKHLSWLCDQYKTVEARQQLMGDLCFKCLSNRHRSADCKSTFVCVYCGKRDHHSSLCYRQFGSGQKGLIVQELNPNAAEFVPAHVNAVHGQDWLGKMQHRGTAVLESALVEVTGRKGSALARVVFDNGSTLSFVRKSLCEQIGAQCLGNAVTSIGRFGDVESQRSRFPVVSLQMRLRNGSGFHLSLREVSTVSTPIRLVPLDYTMLPRDVKQEDLAESMVEEPHTAEIDLLLGLDYYYDIVGPEQWRSESGLVVKQTAVGKIVTGCLRENMKLDNEVQLLVVEAAGRNSSLLDLERFWRLEDIGIMDSPGLKGDEIALEHFQSTVKVRNGRYEVQWPFKSEKPELPTNYEVALRRLNSVHRKLGKDPKLAQAYDKIFQDQLEKGIIEAAPEVPEGLEHYLPHHAVVTPGKETTKVRVVFDASSKATAQSPSLNDTMYRGPVFLNDLVGMLLRFRLPKVAIVSDVEKAFLQISLQASHRDCTRFLWLKNPAMPPTGENIVIYRYARVAFGMKASPFLLGATIVHHCVETATPTAVDVKDNTYMDNVFGGCESTKTALEYYTEAKSLFRQITMNLRELYSNDEKFLAKLPDEDRGKSHCPSVLGLKWNTSTDTVHCTCSALISETTQTTKRSILKFIASTYDPCGWFSAVTMRGKLIMQKLWQMKIAWDEPVDASIVEQWKPTQKDIAAISKVELPRRLVRPEGTETAHELHVFCDASSNAYAAAVYLKTNADGATSCDLVFAKTRVAPLKPLTIPKLELMATLLGVRMLKFVAKELKVPIRAKFLGTDSSCVLGWLNRDKVNVVFVENRLKEIRASPEVAFGHVKTDENPADIPSRGVELETLKNSQLWWKGPTWLVLEEREWPRKALIYEPALPPEPSELVGRIQAMPAEVDETDSFLDVRQFSSATKLLRVTAFVFRAIDRMRSRKAFPLHLSAKELNRAVIFWEKRIQQTHSEASQKPTVQWKNMIRQLGLFWDELGLLRCRGRFASAGWSQDARHPKLLPAKHPFTKLMILQSHANAIHTGVKGTLAVLRQSYWVPNGRNEIKKALRNCQLCRKHFGGPFRTPEEAPLPGFRSQLTRPFAVIGLDYVGPLFVRVDGQEQLQKVWVALYTCAAVRAVHLELVNSLNAKDFLLSLRRFMAIYGAPEMIVSDNAKQFKAGNQALDRLWEEAQEDSAVQDFAASHGISWKFIAEKAPWMGGIYERLVALVKHALKASLGKWSLTRPELHTLLYEVAFVLNGRPLTYSEDDPADLVLTPLHFMFRSRDMFPEVTGEIDPGDNLRSADDLLRHWKAGQNLLREFWELWRNQYLLALRESWRPKRERGVSNIPAEKGVVVLIKDQLPRGMWKIGRISALRRSGDGKVRAVEVALPGGSTVIRPVMHHVIEVPPNHPLSLNHCYNQFLPLGNKQITSLRQGYSYIMLLHHGQAEAAEKLLSDPAIQWSPERMCTLVHNYVENPNVNFLAKTGDILKALVLHQIQNPESGFCEAFEAEMRKKAPDTSGYQFRVYTSCKADMVLTSGLRYGEWKNGAQLPGENVYAEILQAIAQAIEEQRVPSENQMFDEMLSNMDLFKPIIKKSLLLVMDSQARLMKNITAGTVVPVSGGKYRDMANALRSFDLFEYRWIVVYCGTNCSITSAYTSEQRRDEWEELRWTLVNEAARRDKPSVLFCCAFEQPFMQGTAQQAGLVELQLKDTPVLCINWMRIGNPFLKESGLKDLSLFDTRGQRSSVAKERQIHINEKGLRVIWRELCARLNGLKFIAYSTRVKPCSIPKAVFEPPQDGGAEVPYLVPGVNAPLNAKPGPSKLQVATNAVRSEERMMPKEVRQKRDGRDRKRCWDGSRDDQPQKRRYEDRHRRY